MKFLFASGHPTRWWLALLLLQLNLPQGLTLRPKTQNSRPSINMAMVTSNSEVIAGAATTSSGTSISLQMYIEHTDAFSVVYNANYPLFVERALSPASARIISMKTLKYRSPARLGDKIEVSLESSRRSPDRVNARICTKDTEIATANTIEFQSTIHRLPAHIETTSVEAISNFQSEFRLWRDELGPDNTILTKTAFQLFERARTDILGGPEALASLSSKLGINVYVARMVNYRLLNDFAYDEERLVVRVVTDAEPMGDPSSSGVTMVNFNQRILSTTTPAVLHATAVFTCSCVDANSGLPIPFPASINSLMFPR